MKQMAAFLLFLLLALPACAAAEAPGAVLIEKSSSVYTSDGCVVTEYFQDEILLRADGVCEVRGRRVTESVESRVRWLYTAAGTPIGMRTYESGGAADTLNYLYFVDLSPEDYIAYRENVERVEGDTIYYADGGTEQLILREGRICQTIYRAPDGSWQDMRLNEYGLMEELSFYSSADGLPWCKIVNEYVELPLN